MKSRFERPVSFSSACTTTRALSGATYRRDIESCDVSNVITTSAPPALAASRSFVLRRGARGTEPSSTAGTSTRESLASNRSPCVVATFDRTAAMSVAVSTDGPTPSSVCKYRSSPSYARRAPARSPARSSNAINRRAPCSSSGARSTARRAKVTPSTMLPARSASSAASHAARAALARSARRSLSSQCSNSGASGRKTPGSRCPR